MSVPQFSECCLSYHSYLLKGTWRAGSCTFPEGMMDTGNLHAVSLFGYTKLRWVCDQLSQVSYFIPGFTLLNFLSSRSIFIILLNCIVLHLVKTLFGRQNMYFQYLYWRQRRFYVLLLVFVYMCVSQSCSELSLTNGKFSCPSLQVRYIQKWVLNLDMDVINAGYGCNVQLCM